MPPTNAPGIEPMPPNTAAVNALMPGIEPVVGIRVGYAEQSSTPAIAARPEPMAKVSEMVVLTLMPISCAAPLSSDTARIAVPALLLLVNRVSATIITTQITTVTMVTGAMVSWPSNSEIGLPPTTEVKLFVLEPQISSAAFCRK